MGWESLRRLRPSPPRQRVNVQFNKGEHGFHNEAMDMKTIFRAVGPSFRRGLEVEPFESVHVYELMCLLLGIVPEANDGLLSTLLPMLWEASHGPQSTPSGKGLPIQPQRQQPPGAAFPFLVLHPGNISSPWQRRGEGRRM